MSYTSVIFFCCVIALGILYYIVPKKFQWSLLLIASIGFYMVSAGSKTLILVGAAAVIYAGGLIIDKMTEGFKVAKKDLEKAERKALKAKVEKRKKVVVGISVVLLLLMILSTKYFNLFIGILHLGTPIKLLLPLGISYYTLMGISYIVDVYRGTVKAEKNPLMLLLYLSYVPHIVEGPFDRFDSLSTQFRTPVYLDYERIKYSAIRIGWGLFKIMVVANRAGIIVNTVFGNLQAYDGKTYVLVILLYTLQIYAEFSGCMDLVCGVSSFFGVNIAENFKRPFFATSINEFWRRWHITLGLWLKDYVFYPVSLSGHFKKVNEVVRKHTSSKYLLKLLPSAYALFFVWFCNGLWHGASLKYILYGLYYYVLMMIGQALAPVSDRVLDKLSIRRETKGYHLFKIIRTCIIVCFGMLIFRAATLGEAARVFAGIFTNFSNATSQPLIIDGITGADYFVLAIGFLIILGVSIIQEKEIDIRGKLENQVLPVRWIFYMALIYSIIIFGAYGGNFTNTTFIYGEF